MQEVAGSNPASSTIRLVPSALRSWSTHLRCSDHSRKSRMPRAKPKGNSDHYSTQCSAIQPLHIRVVERMYQSNYHWCIRAGNTHRWDAVLDPFDHEEVMGVMTRGSTADAWSLIEEMCGRNIHFGHGPLDAFLSGDEVEKRIEQLERHASEMSWLRMELADTMSMDQSGNLSADQIARLQKLLS